MRVGIATLASTAPDENAPEASMICVDALEHTAALVPEAKPNE